MLDFFKDLAPTGWYKASAHPSREHQVFPAIEADDQRIKAVDPRGTSYILGHQLKSFDWRARNAKPHPLKKVPEDAYTRACETLNQIIAIGS
jgi:hypothetical protein